ncbi:MAG TPA: glycosyltransferase [Marmoricola sp.]|nr:glycosyltransferase [Marmoricola sp.]
MPDRILTPLLSVTLDFEGCARDYERGLAPDRYPYGLETLPPGWRLAPPRLRLANRATDVVRRAVARVTGADLVAAWQRWPDIRRADVVYSHSESDYLGAACLLRLTRRHRPLLVGHTIWLFGGWSRLPRWKRGFLRWAMQRVDLFVYNAEPNLRLGQQIVPEGSHHYVPFGISRLFTTAVARAPDEATPLLLSVGGDRARDWATLAEALREVPEHVRVRLATDQVPLGTERAEVRPATSLAELFDLYRRASCMVVALRPNAHASGITAILEGVAAGVPLVATDTGGLREYFDETEIAFVPVGDAAALAAAVRKLLEDPAEAVARAGRARARLLADGYTNDAYWQRVLAVVIAADDVSRRR